MVTGARVEPADSPSGTAVLFNLGGATLSGMSWLARLFGQTPPAAADQASTTVVVPADIAERLTADGAPLAVAVEAALREQLAAAERAEAPVSPGNGDKPFWLARDDESSGDLEERLRDRIAQRRTSEGEAER